MPDTPSVLIIGAGPAGLSMACALADAGIASTVLDGASEAELADPGEDGREIALTHRGIAILQALQAWPDLPSEAISPLRQARVFNGTAPQSLHFGSGNADRLGALVPNHWLRRIAWQGAQRRPLIQLRPGTRVDDLGLGPQAARLLLPGGETLCTPLLIAADSRFSASRRRAGIGAEMRDFGRSVLLCRVEHERPHQDQALECFHHGHTMAWLPLGGYSPTLSSLVLTLPTDQAHEQRAWSDRHWLGWVQEHSQDRFGRLRLAGPRHHYPLVATYAHRFVARRFALIGDSAVGMHPVTAHGYNFGLYGIETLAALLTGSIDPGDPELLARYAATHRRATWPIYQGTNALVKLFTDERPPARLLRQGVIAVADSLPPLKALITAQLTGQLPSPFSAR
ncbi:5-demethoxyubiquinol-8 5-hydroxylase UbiM [Pelomonas sp. SE-A7]|uniref:5-demethoxyubiquinol-8 5-hydroxylase UbiM n=1 Tax=Pelomonas sp. SE-A7 TaxID=3054953 RepID=UPI00259CE77C|nr:5-demethoxyubiquinol-8 5-hydroxylase UbiM [Pelomonas sp. SE-A7]MDM4765675.1 5-demethoxyubiquinol-8 5-hydroxylase UbiM [Pelomonas sp. SE-A7]